MTLATQTWRVAGPYTLRTSSLIDRLTDIKDAFVANNADANGLWQEDTFGLTGSHLFLKIKRKGSPSGSLGTFRGIIFGTTSASSIWSASINVINTSEFNLGAANVLFMGCGEAIDTTAPTMTDITATAMFNLITTKFTKGFTFDGVAAPTSGSTIGLTTTMYIVECDKMCAIVLLGASIMSYGVFGACVEDLASNTEIWACFGGSNIPPTSICTQTSRAAATIAERSVFPIFNVLGGMGGTAGGYACTTGAYNNGAGAISEVGRIWCAMTHGVNTSVLESGGNALIVPVFMGRKAAAHVATSDYGLLGLARQIRMGPLVSGGIKRIFNGVPELRGYIAAPLTGGATQGVVFDNSP